MLKNDDLKNEFSDLRERPCDAEYNKSVVVDDSAKHTNYRQVEEHLNRTALNNAL